MIAIACALVGWLFAVFLVVANGKDKQLDRQSHAAELTLRDEKIKQLIDQLQLNAQSLPYYPTLGPAPAPEAEPRYLEDAWGFIAEAEIDAVAGE